MPLLLTTLPLHLTIGGGFIAVFCCTEAGEGISQVRLQEGTIVPSTISQNSEAYCLHVPFGNWHHTVPGTKAKLLDEAPAELLLLIITEPPLEDKLPLELDDEAPIELELATEEEL